MWARERHRSEATAQSRRATGPEAPRPNAWTLNAATDQAAFAAYGWTDLDPARGCYETGQGPAATSSRHPPRDRPSRLPMSSQLGLPGRLEPSARSDSGQSRGCFSKQTHDRAGYFEVVGGCGDRCRGRPDDSDHGGLAVGPDELDRECVGTVDRAGGQDG